MKEWPLGGGRREGGVLMLYPRSNNDGMVRHSYRLVVTRLGSTLILSRRSTESGA